MFFELARSVKEVLPKVFMCENVKGLSVHDGGRTLDIITNTIHELGYTLVEPHVLHAIKYQVSQKRECLILVTIRNDYASRVKFRWPAPYYRILKLRGAFFKGILYDTDVSLSEGQKVPNKETESFRDGSHGGYWRDLPLDIQKEYMGEVLLWGVEKLAWPGGFHWMNRV